MSPQPPPSIGEFVTNYSHSSLSQVDGDTVTVPKGAKELTALVMTMISLLLENEIIRPREICNEFFEQFDKFGDVGTWDGMSDILKKFMEKIRDSMPEEDRIVFKLENEGRYKK